MANVFLSYERMDEPRARPIAAILDHAGHSVWWDRQIKGGGEFDAEIEAALKAADKIIVLWSERAVKSAWVRDEAAVGRDTGRLIPATIDGSPGPRGFRQFQTIDLSRWRGRASAPEMRELLNALDSNAPPAPRAKAKRPRFPVDRGILMGGAALVSLVVAGFLLWQNYSAAGGETPSFAIVAADDSADSKQLAADVRTRIAGFNDPSAADFRVAGGDSSGQRNGLRMKVGARGTLTLISGTSGSILWSMAFDASQATRTDLAQAAAMTAHRALSCAADALMYRRERIEEDTLKSYLKGCTLFDSVYDTNILNTSLDSLFEAVIARAPHFGPAWSKLFALESEDVFTPGPERKALVTKVRAQLERVRQLGLDVPEAYAVRANLLSPADFVGIFRTFDEGIEKHPNNAFLYRLRGERYSYVGRWDDALGDTGHAVELDPLSPATQQAYATELAYSGNTGPAYEQLRKIEQLWPNALTVAMARYRMDLRFGDPREAQALYKKYALQTAQNPAQGLFIEARIDPTPEKIEAALEAERQQNRQFPPFISSVIQALGHFGRKDEAIDLLVNYPGGKWAEWIGYNAEVLFRPMMKDVWRDPRSMAGAAHVGLLHYWRASAKWPDFCFQPNLPYDCKKEAAKYPG
jgi:tetratricopeptide (TPR) repeat protein